MTRYYLGGSELTTHVQTESTKIRMAILANKKRDAFASLFAIQQTRELRQSFYIEKELEAAGLLNAH